MSVAFRNCIKGSADRGVISRDQADQILERYETERQANGGDGLKAKAKIAGDLTAEAAERKRREILATKAAQRIAEDVRGFRNAAGQPDIVSAVTRLFENVGHTGYSSVRGRTNALLGAAMSEIEDLLHATRRNFLTMRQRTEVNPADLVKAAFGEDTTPAAKAFYGAWTRPAEKLRGLFNEAGGAIGWRDDWGLPTAHDAGAILHAGFDRWREFIDPRLKWDAMRHPLSDTPILAGEHDAVLRHVYDSVVMEGWNTRDPSRGGGGRPSLANSRSDARFLQFNDAAAWTDYNRQFGRGNVHDVMMGHLAGMAKDVGAMQVLGPNPAATTQWLKQIIQQERAKKVGGYPSLFKGSVRGFGRPEAIVDSMYEMARGSGTPENVITQGYSLVANTQMAAKLGSAVLVHAAINPLIEANARAHYGIPVLKMMADLPKSLSGADNREIARMGLTVGDAMHSLEGGARQQAAFARMTEASRWLPAITTHYSGLEAGVASLRRAWWWGAAGAITKTLEQPFAEIPARQRMLLEGFGLNERDWGVMQAADLYEPDQGASFLRWKEIAQAGIDKPDAVRAALGLADDASASDIAKGAEATAMKYLEMLHQSMEFAVPSSRWRSRATLTLGTKEGTYGNLVAKSFSMFKGFIGSATVSYVEAMRQELARNRAVGAAAAGANLIALTALGTLVLQLKTMSTGKDLLPMDPRTEDGRTTLAHGALTSGALSLFGDFLSSDRSSYGHGPLETLAGPVVTGALDAYGLVKSGAAAGFRAIAGNGRTPPPPPGKTYSDTIAGVRQLLQNNTPLLSTHWAFRAAYNRVVLDQLQFLMDPASHSILRKNEAKLFKETGVRYYWPSGAVTPTRPPQLTPGRP